MRAQMLSVVVSSLVVVMLLLMGCGKKDKQATDERKRNGNETLNLTDRCAKGKMPHLGHCYDSIHLSDEIVGFTLKSSKQTFSVQNIAEQEWLDRLVTKDLGNGKSLFRQEDCASNKCFLWHPVHHGTTRKVDGTNHITSLLISTFLTARKDLDSLAFDDMWFVNGTIKLNGKIYDLPIDRAQVVDAYQGRLKDEDITSSVTNGRIKINFSFWDTDYEDEVGHGAGNITYVQYEVDSSHLLTGNNN